MSESAIWIVASLLEMTLRLSFPCMNGWRQGINCLMIETTILSCTTLIVSAELMTLVVVCNRLSGINRCVLLEARVIIMVLSLV